ncbi:MAG: DUF4350 domain-containing protein, partial [Planctomycetota bacterium]
MARLYSFFEHKRTFLAFLILFFLISLSIRLWWTLEVQPPGETIYSDMSGYINRAKNLLTGEQAREQGIGVIAYGGHYFYALQMALMGIGNYTAMSIVGAVISALTVVIVTVSARMTFKSVWGGYLTGILAAVWYPIVCYTGYFSTELPYCFFMSLSILLTLWFVRSGRGAFLTGIIYAIGFSVRPQLIMTAILFWIWLLLRRSQIPKFQWRSFIYLIIPMVAIAGFSMYRHHYFTGRIALISGNAPVNRLFASSEYKRIVCEMEYADGVYRKRTLQPPSARNLGYNEVFHFKGYLGDSKTLGAERNRIWSQYSWQKKLSLYWRNVALLAYKNTMWPERDRAKEGWRKGVFVFWPGLMQYYVFPMAFLGFLTLFFRLNLRLEIFAIHYLTMLYTALMYIGEIRYRVPYDFVLIILMIQAVLVILKLEPKIAVQDYFGLSRWFCKRAHKKKMGVSEMTGGKEPDNEREPMKTSDRIFAVRKSLFSISIFLVIALAVTMMLYGGHSALNYGCKGHRGAKICYDAVHGTRHAWNRDNQRYRYGYHSVSGYRRFCRALEENGFDLHVEQYHEITPELLNQYDVYIIGEQNHYSRFMKKQEQRDLMNWVKEGGGLFVIVEHTNCYRMGEIVNELLEETPIQVRYDTIMDLYRKKPNTRTTWVKLEPDEKHPITANIESVRFFNGASFETEHGILFSADTSWSDRYNPESKPVFDGNRKKDPNELLGSFAGAAAVDYGKGRVVVMGDHNPFSNNNIYYGGHYGFAINSMKWLSRDRYNLEIFFVLIGTIILFGCFWLGAKKVSIKFVVIVLIILLFVIVALTIFFALVKPNGNFFVHADESSDCYFWSKKESAYYTLYGQWTKEPHLHPWSSENLKDGYDALILAAPMDSYSLSELEIIDGYLSRGKNIVYLASVNSLNSAVGKQLMDKFGFKVSIATKRKRSYGMQPMDVSGDKQWVSGVCRFYVNKKVPEIKVENMKPLVGLSMGDYDYEADRKMDDTAIIDLISYKKVGRGKFYLVTPLEIFNNKGLSGISKEGTMINEQMCELAIR